MGNQVESSQEELRKRPRKKCTYMPVDFVYMDQLQTGLILDLSESGARIENQRQLQVGETTTMTFLENYLMGPVKTSCRVVRSFENGFAVTFDTLTMDHETAISGFVGYA